MKLAWAIIRALVVYLIVIAAGYLLLEKYFD